MRRGISGDEREELRALVAGAEENARRVAQLVRRKGFLVDTAFTFEEALEYSSRYSYTIAVLDLGEGEFAETSWLELLESLGVETQLFCLIPEQIDPALRKRLEEDEAVLLPKPVDAEALDKPLQEIVRESSSSLTIPKVKSKGMLRMRDYDDE